MVLAIGVSKQTGSQSWHGYSVKADPSHLATNRSKTMTTNKFHKENEVARIAAEAAYEEWHDMAADALRLARQCKGEEVDPMVKALASSAGRMAAEKRAELKAKQVAAAQARRLACAAAMPKPSPPPLPRDMFGGKMPVPPNRQ